MQNKTNISSRIQMEGILDDKTGSIPEFHNGLQK
jgi:hypothetical protein